ncbi:MAG: Nif3-like dinuclear metal center hexameric protein [Lewinellaceae bacterium]|nr:Nif3-like dinuclear metal center hexameric protein [Lewinellaceae bacterium]
MASTIREVISYLESIAPSALQESYDNAGLIVGDPTAPVRGVLTTLDVTEAVVAEAVARGCNLIVAHHPIVFRGLKQITGRTYVERVVIAAIRQEVAIYAIHTNLDHVYDQGVNSRIASRLGLQDTRILSPKGDVRRQLTTLVPEAEAQAVGDVLLQAGVDQLRVLDKVRVESEPVENGTRFEDALVQLTGRFYTWQQERVLKAIYTAHPHEIPTVDIAPLLNTDPNSGAGLIGTLPEPTAESAFLDFLRERMQLNCIRHTRLRDKPVTRVAVCGGAGSFLLGAARAQGADVFVTADFKYHEFFDAEGQLVIADIGHFESEQFTIALLQEIISEKFSNFAAYCTTVNTNPVYYHC